MVPSAMKEFIPENLNDISSIATIECTDTATFAALIPEVMKTLSLHGTPGFGASNTLFGLVFSQLVRQRATDPAVVSTISYILIQPLVPGNDLNLAYMILFEVIYQLSEDDILRYRQALMTLSKADSIAPSDPRYTSSLALHAQDILRFIDNPEVVWVPKHSSDYMGERTLKERVHTARDMRPHVDSLLSWLRNRNWPIYGGCKAQLARFPEITVTKIRKILINHRGDGEWTNNLLRFVHDHVPVGRSWEAMYPQVKALLDESKGDEIECKTPEYAASWIQTLERWRGSQEGLRCA